jgi:hypothetical protein
MRRVRLPPVPRGFPGIIFGVAPGPATHEKECRLLITKLRFVTGNCVNETGNTIAKLLLNSRRNGLTGIYLNAFGGAPRKRQLIRFYERN